MMQKTYLSRAVTRAMALDHPIGDPTGGPLMGEKREPVSATIAVATMASTYAAAGSFAAMTLFSGLAFAGAAVSLIGNITGNKTLSKIGMIAGIAGGVGALAEGALGFSSGTLGETFGFGEAAAGMTGATANASSSLVNSPAVADVSGPMTPVIDGAQAFPVPDVQNIPPSIGGGGGAAAAAGANGPLDSTFIMQEGAPNAMQVAGPSAGEGATAPLTMGGINEGMIQSANKNLDPIGSLIQQSGGAIDPGYASNIREMTGMESAWQGVKDAGKGVFDFVKQNPGAAMTMGQMVGGISEWLSGKSDAEIAALEAATGYNDARAMAIQEQIALEKQRRMNLNTGYQQVDARIQTNPNASMPMPWQPRAQQAAAPQSPQPGLIAGARAA